MPQLGPVLFKRHTPCGHKRDLFCWND